MTNERSNGYAAGRDSLRWAVEKTERLEAGLARAEARVKKLDTLLRLVRYNMEARSIVEFDYENSEYPVTGETITLLCLEKQEMKAENERLRSRLETTQRKLDEAHTAMSELSIAALATKPGEGDE